MSQSVDKTLWFVIAIMCAGFILVVLRTAWIADDAYITFRSIGNIIHGYGPVHNIGERVQTFTHLVPSESGIIVFFTALSLRMFVD